MLLLVVAVVVQALLLAVAPAASFQFLAATATLLSSEGSTNEPN
jgi:hypothetical protein